MAVMRWVRGTGLACGLLAGCSGPTPELAPLPEIRMDGLAPALAERLGPTLRTLESQPRNADAAARAGMLLQAYEQHGPAITYLTRARALDPDARDWNYYLGISLTRLGQHAEAADAFRRCAEIDPGFLPAQRRLADSLLASNEIDASRSHYRRLVASAPHDARLRYGLGRAEAAAGNMEGARDELRRAVDINPGFGAAHYSLAQTYRQLGIPTESERHLALYERHRDGVPSDADDPLMAAVRALRVSAAEYLQQGVEAKVQGRVEDAIRLHVKALEEDPDLVQARVNLVILYGSSDQSTLAEEQYRLALAGGEGTAELHYNFGVLAYGASRTQEAREAFRKALEINPDHALANHNLGQMLEEEGRLDEAMDRYRLAIANRPEHGLSHYKIGMLWMRQRRADAAVRSFREAIRERSDRTPTYRFSLAAALLASGNRHDALRTFQQARAEAARLAQQELVDRIDETLRTLDVGPG